MKIIAIIVTLVCCCLMFVVKREKKAALLIMGAMTLTLVNVPDVPLHNANYLLQVALLLSEWKYLSRHLRELRRTPFLWKMLLLVSGSTLVAALTTTYVELREILQSELLFKYFALAYAFCTVKDERSLKPILRISFYCLIVLTFFGVLNYLDKSAMFVNALTEGKTSAIYDDNNWGDIYSVGKRFRVQSMFKSAFDYGYICAALLILHLHGWHRHFENKKTFIIALVCCSFGIITCECRIVWVCAFLSVVCYCMLSFKMSENMLLGIFAVIAMIIAYNTVPIVEEKVNKVTDIFIEDSETSGSSIQLRSVQYMYVLYYTEGNEILGLGKGYWSYTFEKNPSMVYGLAGIESVILAYLLERGIFGLVLWIAFYTILFLYFRRKRPKNKLLTGLGLSILSLYITFAIGTGELGSVYPTMLLLGYVIKAIESAKTKRV